MRFIGALILLVMLGSCKKHEGCTEFGTENYDPEAVINDGSCILVRDKFLGMFDVSSDCISNNYVRNITLTADDQVVTISNLADTLGSVEARVYGNNITIEPQLLHTSISVEGAGVYIDTNMISISYKIRDSRTGSVIIHDCFEYCVKL